jgi:hypothetical protein
MSVSGSTNENLWAMKHPTRTGKWNLIHAAGGGSFKNHYCIFSMSEIQNKAVSQEQNMP